MIFFQNVVQCARIQFITTIKMDYPIGHAVLQSNGCSFPGGSTMKIGEGLDTHFEKEGVGFESINV